MVLEDGLNYAGIGGLMATAMKYRGLAGAVIDASVRDTPQIASSSFRIQSRSCSVYFNQSLPFRRREYSGDVRWVRVNPGDIISADEDGVVAIPRARAADILKKAQDLDDTEHRMIPFIENSNRSKKQSTSLAESDRRTLIEYRVER
jgi:regulator of RNase E activity RraA